MPNRGGFSWKRLIGLTRLKPKISRKIGIPFTKRCRQRKFGALFTKGCACSTLFFLLLIVTMLIGVVAFLTNQFINNSFLR